MRYFEDATARSYGSLMVYLKPTTPDTQRLIADILYEFIRGQQSPKITKYIPEQFKRGQEAPKITNDVSTPESISGQQPLTCTTTLETQTTEKDCCTNIF